MLNKGEKKVGSVLYLLAVVRASAVVRLSTEWLSCERHLTVGRFSPGSLLPGWVSRVLLRARCQRVIWLAAKLLRACCKTD